MVKDRAYVDIIFTARNVCISNGSYIGMKFRYYMIDEIEYRHGHCRKITSMS